MLSAVDIYRWLMSAGAPGGCEAFDAHVLACPLALAVVEHKAEGTPLTAGLGLSAEQVRETYRAVFPHAERLFAGLDTDPELTVSEEEQMLRHLLFSKSTERSPLEARLAAVIARRALRPHHLWQDLGLRSRRDLSWLMARHFEPLSTRNDKDMKWKKFLYRAICRDAHYALCTAPTCTECTDHAVCFGDEEGESLLASARTAESPDDSRPEALATAPIGDPA